MLLLLHLLVSMDVFLFSTLSFSDNPLLRRLSRFQFALLPLKSFNLAHPFLIRHCSRVVVVRSVRHHLLLLLLRWRKGLLDLLLFLQSPLSGPFQIFLDESEHSSTIARSFTIVVVFFFRRFHCSLAEFHFQSQRPQLLFLFGRPVDQTQRFQFFDLLLHPLTSRFLASQGRFALLLLPLPRILLLLARGRGGRHQRVGGNGWWRRWWGRIATLLLLRHRWVT